MDLDLYYSELVLFDSVPVRLSSAKGVRVVCTAGTVWLTVEGEAGDIFLRAGEIYRLRGNGLALIEGIAGDGRVRFMRNSHSWRMIAGRLFNRLRRVLRASPSGSWLRPKVA